jgi:hypothetical protein
MPTSRALTTRALRRASSSAGGGVTLTVLTRTGDDAWCLRCGRCLELDSTGRCRECSYMVRGDSPDRLDRALAEIEAAREAAADAGLHDVYAALGKAQAILTHLDGEP